ncbi:MAG: prepilin-type N-terminal cleavage/methylation domain-containing protein [Lysobacter sp.]|nr:prepilin-type N-terminal cleavage/methylation domain-containing protein [Lysobacter sp.]
MKTAHGSCRAPDRMTGFTLIELMVVVAVVAILASIALPAYQDSIRKGRRGQAKSDLVELAQRAERFRTINNTYVGFALSTAEARSPRTGPTPFYGLALSNQTATTFTLTATPVAASGQARDSLCMNLSVNQLGQKQASADATNANRCW